MSSSPPSPLGEPRETESPEGSLTSEPIPASSDSHTRRNPFLWAVAFSIVLGGVAWALGETRFLQYQAEITDVSMMGHAYRDASPETRRAAELRTVRLRTVVLGALAGLSAGVAGGLVRRRPSCVLIGAASGLILGGLLGGLFVFPLTGAYLRAEDVSAGELSRSILLHLGLWLPVGVAAGISLAMGMGEPRRLLAAILGGLIGVTLGTLGYEVLGSLLYPLAETGSPIALEWQPRLLATLLVAVGAAGGAAAIGEFKPARSAPVAQPPSS